MSGPIQGRRICAFVQKPHSPSVKLAEWGFVVDPEREGVVVLEGSADLPDGSVVRVTGAVLEAHGNLSLSVHLPALQPLLATCRWTDLDPYFGVALPGLGVLHLYLERA